MTHPPGQRPAWAEVNLGKLERIYRFLRQRVDARVRLLAVVKADGYGHGAAEVARILETAGADAFGVVFVEEGAELRTAGIRRPVLVLGGLYPGQEQAVVDHWLTPVVYSADTLRSLSRAALRHGSKAPYHLMSDTGMSDLDVHPKETATWLTETASLKGGALAQRCSNAPVLGRRTRQDIHH